MASLKDFKQTGGVSLSDFAVEGSLTPIGNEASNLNLAALTASLSENPESIEATYLKVASRLNGSGEREMTQRVVERARQQTKEKGQKALVSLMTDPDLSDEEREASVNAYMDETSSLYDLQNVVATEALIAESDPDETVEAETARINSAELLDNVNQYRADKQALLNRELAKNNQGLMGNIADFLEIMVPFTEGTVSGRTVSGIRDGDGLAIAQGLAWLGGSKAQVRDTLKGLPIEKRRKVMQIAVDSINESSGIVLPGDNEFARAEMLRLALEENSYGDAEEWLDNTIGVLDLLGVFGLAKGGVKAAARKLGVGRGGRGIEAPIPSPEQAAKDAPYIPEREAPLAETATDAELRAAEDAAEASIADRKLRTEEDASEGRLAARRAEQEQDPVRRAERGAEAREESRRAVRGEGRESLSEAEAASEARIAARRTGGDAARMTDEELRMAEDAAEARRLQLESKVRLEAARAPVQPSSYSQILRNNNPAKSRALNAATTEDLSGQVAKATYGTSRTDAIAHDHLPEVEQLGGEVKNKVSQPEPVRQGPASRIPKSIKDVVDSNGALFFSETQKVAVASKVIHDFNNASGLVTRTEMTVPLGRDLGSNFKVGVTYGPRDNGWLNPGEGVDKVKLALRRYGVRDEDITVLGRQGDEYRPTSLDNPEGTDFLVRVDYDHAISADEVADISGWSAMDIVKNFFDRMPHKFGGVSGTITRSLFDPSSIFTKDVLGGAVTGVLRSATLEKRLGDLTERFTKKFNKLSKDEQQIFEQEVRRANLEGWNKPTKTLKADGWSDTGIAALENWRATWDTVYWLRNNAFAKENRSRGYGIYEDATSNSRLLVKEYKRGAIKDGARVYDPITDEMRNLAKHEIDEIYEKGGSVGKVRSKFIHNGEEAVEQIVVRNNADAYVRRVRDDDQILNYREGYYTVYYDAPHFIDEIVSDKYGRELMRKAVKTSRDLPTAERTAKGLNDNAPPNTRYERRDAKERASYTADDLWEITESSGGVAQKVRGERLGDANSAVTDEAEMHVLGPADSMIRAIRSVSPKVGMGEWFDAIESRTIAQFGHMFPKDKYGNPVFPPDTSPGSIRADKAYGAEARDARTIVEYINSMKRSYYNSADDGVKNLFRAFAEASGERGLSKVERAAEVTADKAGPTRLGKGVAFTLYIATNVPRALLVQEFQAVQLAALAPTYAAGKLGADTSAMMARRLGGRWEKLSNWSETSSKAELDEMYEALDRSGTVDIIDKSNLVKGTMQEVAEATAMGGRRSAFGQITGRASQAVSLARRAGFDKGEEFNKTSAWITHYKLKRDKLGRKLTKSEIDEVTFEAENWTYMMNRAGEFPWNENALGIVMQYLQVPYKAFLTMTTNRHITWQQKAKLAAFNVSFFGAMPSTFLYSVLGDSLPTSQDGWDSEAREAFMQGLGAYLFNKTVGGTYEFFSEDSEWKDLDFSSLRAIDGRGLWEYATTLWSTDAGEIIANTPAGSLVMGYNPRITNAIKSVAELFHFREPADTTRAGVGETLIELGSVSSGFSNAYKAWQIAEYEKIYNSEGSATVDNAPTPTAIAKVFGINTVEEARKWHTDKELYRRSQSYKDDVKERYRLVSRGLWKEGISMEEQARVRETINRANAIFENDPLAREITMQELRKDLRDGNSLMVSRVQQMMRMPEEELTGMINAMPISDDRKANLFRQIEAIDNIRNEE